jgi:hypothetical protein
VGAGLGAGIGSAAAGGLFTSNSVNWTGWGAGAVNGAVAGFAGGFLSAAMAPVVGCSALPNIGSGFASAALGDALGQGAAMGLGLQAEYSIAQTLVAGAMGGALGYFARSCFAAGTPLLWEHGSKPIERFKVGDRVWARNELDPEGPLELKVVEEVFLRHGWILNLHVGGQIIRTTPEHPFYVRGKGWLEAGQLSVGDLLSSQDRRWVPVQDVLDTGEFETVYNLRVADFHTYFVGSRNWGFSVWAHNAGQDYLGMQVQEALEKGELSLGRVVKNPQHHVFPQNRADAAWFAERGINVHDYAVNMYAGEHGALHGGGNWGLAREIWPGEWNTEIMRRLIAAEGDHIASGAGRLLPAQIEIIGRAMMSDYGIGHLPFVKYVRGWLPQ